MFELMYVKPIARDVNGCGTFLNEATDTGYSIWITKHTWAACAEEDRVKLYIRSQFSESDGYKFFGFLAMPVRFAFDVLCRVQGIGGKLALAILEQMSIPQLIAAEDASAFKSIKGVGPKMAAKILPELQLLRDGMDYTVQPKNPGCRDAVDGLVGLGIPRQKAIAAVDKVYTVGKSSQDLIRDAAAHV